MESSRKLVRFGPFEVNLGAGELRKHGLRLRSVRHRSDDSEVFFFCGI